MTTGTRNEAGVGQSQQPTLSRLTHHWHRLDDGHCQAYDTRCAGVFAGSPNTQCSVSAGFRDIAVHELDHDFQNYRYICRA